MVIIKLHNKSELTKNLILYILGKTKRLDGRIKLMKLFFLVEYFDTKHKHLTLEQKIGNPFVVYRFGPFSFSVFNSFLKLVKDNSISEFNHTLQSNVDISKIENKIPEDIKQKTDDILNEFGKVESKSLENKTLELLGINQIDKAKFFGMPVEVLITKKLGIQ